MDSYYDDKNEFETSQYDYPEWVSIQLGWKLVLILDIETRETAESTQKFLIRFVRWPD